MVAIADVILHEAGHTYGLHHVDTLVEGTVHLESMGLRYTDTSYKLWDSLVHGCLISSILQRRAGTSELASGDAQ